MSVALSLLALFAAEPPKTAIIPEGWESTVEALHYSPAVVAGDDVYVSGMVAGVRDFNIEDPREVTDEEIEAAVEWAFKALTQVLEEAGTDWDHVVEINTFHTDLRGQIDAFAKVKDRYVSAPYPAWTAIDIDRLYPDSGIVEIRLRAVLPKGE